MRPIQWANKPHSREARLYLLIRAELVKHVGGQPNVVQSALIDRVAWLRVHLATMDEEILRMGALPDGELYLAMSNSVTRLLRQIGVNGATQKKRTVTEILAERARKQAAE